MPKSKKNVDSPYSFAGFTNPNFTIVPDEVFDELLHILSGAEMKVLLYIIRRTFGFKKNSDDISFSQICNGITTRDGKVLDRGTGLSQSTAQIAIRGLEEKRIITATRRSSAERGNEPTTYSLNFVAPSVENRQRGDTKIGIGGDQEIGIPLYRKSATQETVEQETVIQDIDHSKRPNKTNGELYVKYGTDQQGASKRHAGNGEEERGSSKTKGTLHHRNIENTQGAEHFAGQRALELPPETQEPIDNLIIDIRSELNDQAPIKSTLRRAYNDYLKAVERDPSLDVDRFFEVAYQALEETKKRTGQIKKRTPLEQVDDYTMRGGEKTKMAYFFAVLEDKLGLKPKKEARGS